MADAFQHPKPAHLPELAAACDGGHRAWQADTSRQPRSRWITSNASYNAVLAFCPDQSIRLVNGIVLETVLALRQPNGLYATRDE